MSRVIFLNAPALVGKDEGAKFLTGLCDGVHSEMKKKLIQLTKLIFDVSDEEWERLYTREFKETPTVVLGGKSPREALIFVSETVIKPNLGYDYFGVSAARNIQAQKIHVFSDSGFESETAPVVERVGEENALLIRIYREGFTYEGDSRSYLSDNAVKTIVDYHNDGSFEDYLHGLKVIFNRWLGREIEFGSNTVLRATDLRGSEG